MLSSTNVFNLNNNNKKKICLSSKTAYLNWPYRASSALLGCLFQWRSWTLFLYYYHLFICYSFSQLDKEINFEMDRRVAVGMRHHCSMWTSPKLIKTGFVVRHRNTHPLMPGRHFLIKPAVCRAEEMKELFFPFLWDSRSQSSHALQQGWARVERTVWSLRLWMSLWDSRSHLHYTTNKQRSKQ